MRLVFYRLAAPVAAFVAVAVGLGGCQGNLGSGGAGLAIPQTQPYGQPGGPGGATSQSRERNLDGAVFLTSDMATLPLPPLDGFSVTLQLGAAPPSPSPSPAASATATASASRSGRAAAHRVKTRAVATEPAPGPSATAMPSPVVAPSAASSPLPAPSASGAASPAASASPRVGASPKPAGSGSPKPAPSGSPTIPKTVTKLAIYPDDVPTAPTPQPTGSVQTYPVRKALVRGYLKPGADLTLYGLAAAKFTIPEIEDSAGRGYTVALFAAGKRHREKLVASDARATIAGHVVAASSLDSLVLKKNTGYVFVLYADELAATPGAVPAGYPSPGVNPFFTPAPGSAVGTTPPPGNAPPPGNTFTSTPYAQPSPIATYFH